MHHTTDSTLPGTGASRRARIGWTLVVVAAVAIGASFALSSDDDGAATGSRRAVATPVATAPVTAATLTDRGRYPGELDADTADVASFYAGRVKSVRVRVGDDVASGQPLAELDPVDAVEQIARARAQTDAAAAEERRAMVELANARAELARFEALRAQVSESEIDAQRARAEALGAAVASAAARGAEARAGLRLLEKRVTESVVRAPFAGRIAARHVDPGVIVTAGAPLLRVVATAPLRVRFEVPEQELPGLTVSTPVRVVTHAGARDAGVAARVSGIGAEVDRERRVAVVEAVIEAPPEGWLPGMYAEAVVDRRTVQAAAVVPASAVLSRLQPDGTLATGVLVVDGEVARWRPAVVVTREDERVAIEAEGVAAGAQVLIAGHVDLADGARILITRPADTAAEAP